MDFTNSFRKKKPSKNNNQRNSRNQLNKAITQCCLRFKALPQDKKTHWHRRRGSNIINKILNYQNCKSRKRSKTTNHHCTIFTKKSQIKVKQSKRKRNSSILIIRCKLRRTNSRVIVTRVVRMTKQLLMISEKTWLKRRQIKLKTNQWLVPGEEIQMTSL